MIPSGDADAADDRAALRAARRGRPDHRRRQLALDRLAARTARRPPSAASSSATSARAAASGASQVGYCMMVGGTDAAVERMRRSSTCSRRPDGWGHMGGCGAGHYVKMVHNGVEYGMMQAYAEGFELMHASDYDLDLTQDRAALEPGLGRPLLAARAARAAPSSRRATTWPTSSGCVAGLGRGPLDGVRRDRQVGAGAGDHRCRCSTRFALAPGRVVRGQGQRRAAQPVRRPRGREDEQSRWSAMATVEQQTSRTR